MHLLLLELDGVHMLPSNYQPLTWLTTKNGHGRGRACVCVCVCVCMCTHVWFEGC